MGLGLEVAPTVIAKRSVFYSHAHPALPGFSDAKVRPDEADFNSTFGGPTLPCSAVRESPTPDATLLDFLQSTYDAAANLGKWDRSANERQIAAPIADSTTTS